MLRVFSSHHFSAILRHTIDSLTKASSDLLTPHKIHEKTHNMMGSTDILLISLALFFGIQGMFYFSKGS